MTAGPGPDRYAELLLAAPLFDVELSAVCNLRCAICPRDSITRPEGLMSPETLSAAARFVPEGARVALSGLGEPLLNELAASAVRAFRAAGATVGLVTNATLLDPVSAQGLIDAGLDFIEMSYPSHLPPGGEETAKTILRNVEGFAARRPGSTRAYLSVTVTDETREELPRIREFASRNRLTPLVRSVHSRGGALYRPAAPGRTGCGLFALVDFIAWDGALLSCCNDVTGGTELGRVQDMDHAGLRRAKEDRIRSGSWFPACRVCDDSHRYSLLDRPLPRGLRHADRKP